MKQVAGKLTGDRLERNLTMQLCRWFRMQADGASELELTMQRGVIRGCAMQLLAWCNPIYDGSRVMIEEVERIFTRRVLESQARVGQ